MWTSATPPRPEDPGSPIPCWSQVDGLARDARRRDISNPWQMRRARRPPAQWPHSDFKCLDHGLLGPIRVGRPSVRNAGFPQNVSDRVETQDDHTVGALTTNIRNGRSSALLGAASMTGVPPLGLPKRTATVGGISQASGSRCSGMIDARKDRHSCRADGLGQPLHRRFEIRRTEMLDEKEKEKGIRLRVHRKGVLWLHEAGRRAVNRRCIVTSFIPHQ